MKRNKIPQATWDKIKKEYLYGTSSMRTMAKKYEVSVGSISERCKTEGWEAIRVNIAKQTEAKTIEAIATAKASNAELAETIVHKIMEKIAISVDLIDPTDTQATRQITQCMKDLKDMEVYGLDSGAKDVEIKFAEGMSDYAD